jgi:hypothetical protein
MLEKAQAYEARLSTLKVDARRLFPIEIRGFPAATQQMIKAYQERSAERAPLDEFKR